MSLFDDLSRFLETRLDEFLRANPHLELRALEDQLRGQEEDSAALIGNLNRREKQLEDSILETAQGIQQWHARIEKAKAANRQDLVGPAQEREAALLRQGNHLWGQLKGVKARTEQTKDLYQQIKIKRQEVKTKIAQAAATPKASNDARNDWGTAGWNQSSYVDTGNRAVDPLDESFRRWEAEEELDELKRKMSS
ncbi:MAG: TIGR04376 family protein [Phormidesmis priestleyi]|uniref:TIGR04376 family protein n=1 Tax=Phormidesmis priestleyi TaxID=268141 RepID=A0A2W4ZKK4_9CYAN|nr:MAG: TIGR04376 family protein [Phormidesmis priestleyi]